MSTQYLNWARQKREHVKAPHKESREKPDVIFSKPRSRPENRPDEKTIDLSNAQPSKPRSIHLGTCEGCGKGESQKRFITNEFLCPDCRDDLRYKLITKSTVARLYPLLTTNDLKEAIDKKRIKCYKTKNWHNPQAAPIKLFYEQEIMDLTKRKERKTTSRSRSRPVTTTHLVSSRNKEENPSQASTRHYHKSSGSSYHRDHYRSSGSSNHKSSHSSHPTEPTPTINFHVEKI